MKFLSGKDIVCFSHDWTSDPLSKTHIVRILSKENRILWVNSLANRTPTISKKDLSRILNKVRSFVLERVFEAEQNIFVINPLALPSYGSKIIREFNQQFLLWQIKTALKKLNFGKFINLTFNPAAGLIARKLDESLLIYYCVDEYTAFTGAAVGLKEIEEELCKKADLVIVSAAKLLESKRDLNPKTFLIRHGVDWEHFRSAVDGIADSSLKDLPHPVIGFHGLLADWIDFELIQKIAQRFHRGSVVLIGKATLEVEEKVKQLRHFENIYLLGRKPYSELPKFCRGFDVAINPFVINELTLAANPLKVREYLAAGLQVVSTAIPEVENLRYCLIARTHDEFIRKIEEVLANPVSRSEISDSVKNESWTFRVEELDKIISERR
ncbi:MAG: glycosyltransferase [Pyrinomonadaceae bacterium]|nr:glycosyltransferase [Pyrinomonadaceae bacterium]MCX7639319.1 glycosyltransferase [Pyrinomonadaceae bacterium]MDW8303459.1 glycosyltransferase [Acidobacteriota bacterium]